MKKNEEVILEGFHACKHAVRFGAEIVELVTPDKNELIEMLEQYAPDILEEIMEAIKEIGIDAFASYSNIPIRTPLAGKAIVPRAKLGAEGVVVFLENPRDLENIGAVVRLAAGMNAAGVITTGDVNPWHKNCVRGSQGLHFALPVTREDELAPKVISDRPLYVFDESGEDLTKVQIPNDAVLAFGSERQGVSEELLKKAAKVVKIPQKEGVSSYNLATSVAMGLYHVKISHKS